MLNHKKSEGEISAEEYDELMSLHEKALVHRDIKPQNIMLTRLEPNSSTSTSPRALVTQ